MTKTSPRRRLAPMLLAAALAAGLLSLVPATAARAADVGALALVPVSCSNHPAIRVTVVYYPYTYCYRGSGYRRIQLTQVRRLEALTATFSYVWRDQGGPWIHSSLVPRESRPFVNGTIDYISVP